MTTLEFLEGPMRNGKSLLANKCALNALRDGAVVGLNYELVPDWAELYARRTAKRWETEEDIFRRAKSMWDRCFRFGSLESLESVSRLAKTHSIGKRAKSRESKGLIVIDEVGLYLNARNWKDHMEFIQYLAKLGKMECQMIMVSHSHEDIDKQVQRKIELITSVRNLQKRKFAGISMGFLYRKPKFRYISMIAGSGAGKGYKEDKGSFSLDYDTCDLYDTFFEFSINDVRHGQSKIGNDPQERYNEILKQKKFEKMVKYAPASPWPKQQFYGECII